MSFYKRLPSFIDPELIVCGHPVKDWEIETDHPHYMINPDLLHVHRGDTHDYLIELKVSEAGKLLIKKGGKRERYLCVGGPKHGEHHSSYFVGCHRGYWQEESDGYEMYNASSGWKHFGPQCIWLHKNLLQT